MSNNTLNHVTDILFATLRAALFGWLVNENLFVGLSDEEWTALFKMSARQGVLVIVYDVVSALPKEQQPPRNLNI